MAKGLAPGRGAALANEAWAQACAAAGGGLVGHRRGWFGTQANRAMFRSQRYR
jgi:hypothetical protein